jgi:hypothetical protein
VSVLFDSWYGSGIFMQHQHFLCPFVFAQFLDILMKTCEDAIVMTLFTVYSETCCNIVGMWAVAGQPELSPFSTPQFRC